MEKLREFLNSVSTSEQDVFAKSCGTTIGYLRTAISVKKRFDVDLCIAIEWHSNGNITCEDLRPKTKWGVLRSSKRAPV